MITVHSDGGCRGNQKDNNIGSWAAVMEYKGKTKEIKGATCNTTNNIMEITAVIKALEAIQTTSVPITIYSDSAYIVNCINDKWYKGWIKRGWKNSKKQPVANRKLWERLIELIEEQDDVSFCKVKGHSDNEGNNRADALVNEAMNEMEDEVKQ